MAERVAAAKLDEIPEGGAKVVEVGGRKIAVFHVGGKFYAIDDTCSHEEASLAAGEIDGTEVACPRHGARFDITTGRNLTLPAVLPVQSYEVVVEDDTVYVLV